MDSTPVDTRLRISPSADRLMAANATHWAKFRRAELISISRSPACKASANEPGADSIVIAAQGSRRGCETSRASSTCDLAALAALLVRTLDIQDGMGWVLADFDSEEFAAAVVARIAALGRRVTCTGRLANFAFGASVRARSWLC